MKPIKLLDELTELFKRFPGVGQKQAERFAFFMLRASDAHIKNFTTVLSEAKKHIKTCPVCCAYCETIPCQICTDQTRDRTSLCIVEHYTDMLAIEKTGTYAGLYHILLGALSPLDGIHYENLSIAALLKRLGSVKEVLIATNPTVEGDATAIYLADILKPYKLKITRLAKGIPSGGNIEYADVITLVNALDGRKEI